MNGDYIPAMTAKQQFELDKEEQIVKLEAEVERVKGLLDEDLASKRDVLRNALDRVVRATKYNEPHWAGNTPVDAAISDSMASVRAAHGLVYPKPNFDDDLPF